MNENQYVFTFNSTHHALMFEKAAKEDAVKVIIMPVPRNIGASCGLAIKFSEEYLADIMKLVRDKELNYAALYRIDDSGSQKDYIQIDMKSL